MANHRIPTGELTAEAQTTLSATLSTQWAADLGWMPHCSDYHNSVAPPEQTPAQPACAGADATAEGGSQPSTDAQRPNSRAIRQARMRGAEFMVLPGGQYVGQRADQTGVVEHFDYTQMKSTDRVQVDIETGHAHVVPTGHAHIVPGPRTTSVRRPTTATRSLGRIPRNLLVRLVSRPRRRRSPQPPSAGQRAAQRRSRQTTSGGGDDSDGSPEPPGSAGRLPRLVTNPPSRRWRARASVPDLEFGDRLAASSPCLQTGVRARGLKHSAPPAPEQNYHQWRIYLPSLTSEERVRSTRSSPSLTSEERVRSTRSERSPC